MKPQNIIAKIRANIKKKDCECLFSDCENKSINSHLIQRNGILSNISSDGHLYELKVIDVNKFGKEKYPINFKKLGIKQALSYKLFCNKHDTNLFKNIENTQSNYESYESFILFSYRALCCELRKKETGIEENTRILNSRSLIGKIDKYIIESYKIGYEAGIKDLIVMKRIFEREMKSPKNSFTFFSFKLPKIEIYASSIFNTEDINQSSGLDKLDLENLYIHIIPNRTETLVLIGYHNEYTSEKIINYCKSWKDISKSEFEYKLSSLFIHNIENWGISPTLYENLKRENKQKYIDLVLDKINNYGIANDNSFNLFE